MKKLSLILLLPLIITGCVNKNDISESKNDSESESAPLSESPSDSESESAPLSESPSDSESIIISDDNKYPLNPYGDYIAYLDENKDPSNLETDYNALSQVIAGEKNGILQTSYEKGLLDFFDINNKVVLKINISNSELHKLDNDHHKNNRETYRICSLDISYIGLLFHFEEVGIRQKGNTSRGDILSGDNINLRHYKLSFEETFDDEFTDTPKTWDDLTAKEYRKDRSFFGLSKIDIRWNRNQESTYVREYYAYEMYRNNNALSPRSNPINLKMKVDDKEYNMGIYLAVETLTKSFIKRNFIKSSRNGDLYKLTWGSGQGAKFNPVSDNYFGVETQHKDGDRFYQDNYTYELKTNKDTSTHQAVKDFINTLSEQHGDTIADYMKEHVIYDNFLTFSAISYLLGDPDDLRSNYNNTYVYFTGDTNQAFFIPVDHDRVMGSTGGSGGNPTGNHATLVKPLDKRTGYGGENDSKLFNVTLFSSNSKIMPKEYINRIDEIINNKWMDINKYQSYFDICKNHYQNDVKLSNGINGNNLSFNLQENDNIYGEENLTVSVYLNKKVETFNENKGS